MREYKTKSFTTRLFTTKYLTAPLLALVVMALASCTAKYGPQLHSIDEAGRVGLKPSELFYVENMSIVAPLADEFIRPGEGHIAAMSYYVKDAGTVESEKPGFLQYRKRTDYRMILPLPKNLATGAIELDNTAFVRDFTNVSATIPERTYLFVGGSFSIDSIKSEDLYTSIDAVFRTLQGDSLKYEGRMKFVPRDNFYFRNATYRRQK